MDPKLLAQSVVDKMYENDAFSQWLGIEVIAVGPGTAKLKMTVKPEMLNGFGIAHGGITYSLADSALAFACNSHGRQAVSVETSISHMAPLKSGDEIIAEARELNLGHKVAHYHIAVTNGAGSPVADFKGTVYRTSKDWEV